MKSAKVIRTIDSNGRVVLPKNLLTDILKAKPDEQISVEFFYTDDSIILKRSRLTCFFCDNTVGLKDYQGVKFCPSCLKKINNL